MEKLIDQNIVKNATFGDKIAMKEIVKQYEKPVYHFLFKMTQNVEDAEDLTQETLLKIYRKINKYNSTFKFSTWVFAIAKNTAYDWMRKNKNRELLIINDTENLFEPISIKKVDSPEYEAKSGIIDLKKAMDKIRPVYKSVLDLFYIQGFSYKEIASIHQIPVNTVKTYIYRAKLILKTQLSN